MSSDAELLREHAERERRVRDLIKQYRECKILFYEALNAFMVIRENSSALASIPPNLRERLKSLDTLVADRAEERIRKYAAGLAKLKRQLDACPDDQGLLERKRFLEQKQEQSLIAQIVWFRVAANVFTWAAHYRVPGCRAAILREAPPGRIWLDVTHANQGHVEKIWPAVELRQRILKLDGRTQKLMPGRPQEIPEAEWQSWRRRKEQIGEEKAREEFKLTCKESYTGDDWKREWRRRCEQWRRSVIHTSR